MKVLCYGSLNIDFTYEVDHFVRKGETISSRTLRTCGGGKGLNQSTALAKAGAEVYRAGSGDRSYQKGSIAVYPAVGRGKTVLSLF